MRFTFLILIFLICYSVTLLGQNTASPDKSKGLILNQFDSLKLTIDLNNIERIERILERKEPSWFTTYGTMVVAIVALFGAILTSIISNRRSRINMKMQLIANREDIMSQNDQNRLQEIEKKKLELEFKLKTELKENVAMFINKATILNQQLNYILYSEVEEGRKMEAEDEYSKTDPLRKEITHLYYSIKVSLDGSEKQQELDSLLDEYMKAACIDFNFNKINSDPYEQPIAKLYHKIKSIIHENYQEPC